MNRNILLTVLLIIIMGTVNAQTSFYDFTVEDINGKEYPLYKWLTSKIDNGLENSEVTWNFQKYMIDEEGQLVGHFSPKIKPDNEKLVSWIVN